MVNQEEQGLKVEHRLTGLETSLKDIKENDLKHIHANIEKLFGKMDKAQWLIITVLVSVVISLGLIFFK